MTDIYWQGEAMMLGWAESSTRGRTVTLLLPEDDEHHPFKSATIKQGKRAGQRFMCVFVQLGDDEQPVPVRRLSQEAAALCKSELFWRYADERSMDHIDSEDAARRYLCEQLGIQSRSELDNGNSSVVLPFLALRDGFNQYREQVEAIL